jgi:hypothetical protein
MIRVFLVALLYPICTLSVFGQGDTEDLTVNSQFWFDFNGRSEFTERTGASGMLGYRSISPHIYDKILLYGTYDIVNTKSPEFLKLKKPLINSFHLGGGLYYTDNKDSGNNMELRLTQGLKFFLPSIKQIPLKNYLRLEERFQKTFDGSDWNASFRFRYQIATVIEWKKHLFSFNEGMYIPLNVELFVNLQKAERFNDVIRISPGIGYKFSDEWRAEFYVSYHYTYNTAEYTNNKADQQDGSNDFVFRLRIFKSSLAKRKPALDTKEEDIKELIE